jgi:enoyl-CoA hydratase/carnithine racemase
MSSSTAIAFEHEETTMSERDPNGQIVVEQRGPILLMGLDRVEKRNGFTPKMFKELGEAYTRLENSPDLFVGVLYAKGDHFSGGVDLPQMAEMRKNGQPYVPLNSVDPGTLREPFRKKPVVAAMQGICFTIAMELMLAADIVIAADNCRFAQMEVKRGIMPGYGGAFRLLERAGWGNAMKWLLTGDEFDSAEAYRLGIVQEVVPVGTQFDRALALAARIAEQAPLAVQATIENARLALGAGWLQAATHATARNTFLYGTEDAAEGRQSFAEKRQAKFVGR